MSGPKKAPPARGAEGARGSATQTDLEESTRTLRQFAVQFRTSAVAELESGNLEAAERYESAADRCYARARELGDTGYQLPRVRADQTAQTRLCEVCRKKYQSTRGDARFCSSRCRQTAARRRARVQRDPTVTDRGVKALVTGSEIGGANV